MARPRFAAAWAASQRIYDARNSGEKVAQVVGGEVAANIRAQKNPWRNTCAVRVSYILNQCGEVVPKNPGKTKAGSNGRNYFYRVRDVIDFMSRRWGSPEVVAYPSSGGGPLARKKGFILFEVHGWSDASGHATLFNGVICYDQCYFNEPGSNYRTTRANFWELQ